MGEKMINQYTIYFICDFLPIFGMHDLLSKLFPRDSKKTARYIGMLIYIILDSIIYRINASPLVFFITSIILFAVLVLCYNPKRIFMSGLIALVLQSFGTCSELLSSYLLSICSQNDDEEYSEIAVIIFVIIVSKMIFFAILMLVSCIVRTFTNSIPAKHFLGLIIVPIISTAQLLYIFSLKKFDQYSILGSGNIEAIFVVASVVVINVIFCVVIDKQQELFTKTYENQYLESLVKAQQDFYANDLQLREEMQKIRHDYKNHLIGLRADILSGNTDKVIAKIEKELNPEYLSAIPQCGIFAIDAIISYKSGIAKEHNIDLVPTFKLTSVPQIDSSDISILIGNSLDNAIEYLSEHKECKPKISIKIVYDKGVMDILVENETKSPINIHDNTIDSAKGKWHGYGLKSVQNICEKYDGKLFLTNKNNTFLFNAVLFSE